MLYRTASFTRCCFVVAIGSMVVFAYEQMSKSQGTKIYNSVFNLSKILKANQKFGQVSHIITRLTDFSVKHNPSIPI